MTDLEKLEAEYRRVKEKADAAKAKAQAKLDRAKARNAEKLRKMETKTKIIGGGLLFKMAADGNAAALEVMRELYRQMQSDEARKAALIRQGDWQGLRRANHADRWLHRRRLKKIA